jgi:hypothetical protein
LEIAYTTKGGRRLHRSDGFNSCRDSSEFTAISLIKENSKKNQYFGKKIAEQEILHQTTLRWMKHFKGQALDNYGKDTLVRFYLKSCSDKNFFFVVV